MSFFERFRKSSKKKSISKIELWEKFRLNELVHDLAIANTQLQEKSKSIDFRLKEFKEEFNEEFYNVSHDNVPDFSQIRTWFQPNGKWSNFMGKSHLQSEIYRRADWWKRNNEFVNGTKVKMNNEFGVVLVFDKKEIIRWDTNKQNDSEDWTGLFGTFIENGGEVVQENHEFTFIDENGKLTNNGS